MSCCKEPDNETTAPRSDKSSEEVASDRVYTLDELHTKTPEEPLNRCLRNWPCNSFLQISVGDVGTKIRFRRGEDSVMCLRCHKEWKISLIDSGTVNSYHLQMHAKSHVKDAESNSNKRKPLASGPATLPRSSKQSKVTGFFSPAPKVETKPLTWEEEMEEERKRNIQATLDKLEQVRSAVRDLDRNQSLPDGCPSRGYLGNGGIKGCDGCRSSFKKLASLDDMEVKDIEISMKVCPRCYYVVCEGCSCHHSRGTCYCKDGNLGWRYPPERAWYMGGRW